VLLAEIISDIVEIINLQLNVFQNHKIVSASQRFMHLPVILALLPPAVQLADVPSPQSAVLRLYPTPEVLFISVFFRLRIRGDADLA